MKSSAWVSCGVSSNILKTGRVLIKHLEKPKGCFHFLREVGSLFDLVVLAFGIFKRRLLWSSGFQSYQDVQKSTPVPWLFLVLAFESGAYLDRCCLYRVEERFWTTVRSRADSSVWISVFTSMFWSWKQCSEFSYFLVRTRRDGGPGQTAQKKTTVAYVSKEGRHVFSLWGSYLLIFSVSRAVASLSPQRSFQ